MKKYLSIMLCLCLLSLFGIQNVPAFAESISGVIASIDGNKLVTVSGTVAGGAGRLVNIRITDPEGDAEYVGNTVSAAYGGVVFTYAMTNASAGRYSVSVSALGVSAPVAAYFEYGTNNSLSALALSQGALDKAFSPEIAQYAVTVDNRVDSLMVTPTAPDATEVIKVNGTVVTSGSPSGAILLKTGSNVVNVAVTALNGSTRTYSITVSRQKALSAALSAVASIDASKQVIVSGTVTSGAGQLVTVKITAPDNSIEYAGATTSGNGGGFRLTYNLSNSLKGRYTVTLGSLGVAQPVTVYLDYGNDAGLQNLSISNGTLNPVFGTDTMSYTVDAPNNISSISVTPTVRDGKASVKVNDGLVTGGGASDPIALHYGSNIINVIVTAQDGVTAKNYTITVYKAALLPAGISVSAQINKEKLVTISGSTTLTTPSVSVMITDPNGRLEYANASPTAAGGAFTFSYTMTNTAKGRYYVNVGSLGLVSPALTYFIYDPSNADLRNLSISGVTLDPAFSPGNLGYKASVGYATNMITITPTTSDPYAAVKVNDVAVAYGSSSGYISLNVGDNTIRLVVTAQDGTQKTYTVTIHRDDAPPPPPAPGNNNNANW